MKALFSSSRFFLLAVAVIVTVRVQALWMTDDPFAMFLPVVLWLGLLVDWLVHNIFRRKEKTSFERQMWVLPLCFGTVVACGVTRLPTRLLFWKQVGELKAVEKQPFQKVMNDNVRGVGSLRPFQIAKSGGDTRFLLWEDRPWFSVKTAVGLAHCPHDAGCGRASFKSYWDYNGGHPVYIPAPPIEYYWDYSNGGPVYVSLGHDWYATKVSVEDVGD